MGSAPSGVLGSVGGDGESQLWTGVWSVGRNRSCCTPHPHTWALQLGTKVQPKVRNHGEGLLLVESAY